MLLKNVGSAHISYDDVRQGKLFYLENCVKTDIKDQEDAMKKNDTIEALTNRMAEACGLFKLSSIKILMQANDLDPLSFSSVIRSDGNNPFGTDEEIILNTKVSSFMRSREIAHKTVERMIHDEDINRTPEFVSAYLTVKDDGSAKIYVHYGIGFTKKVIEKVISQPMFKQNVA